MTINYFLTVLLSFAHPSYSFFQEDLLCTVNSSPLFSQIDLFCATNSSVLCGGWPIIFSNKSLVPAIRPSRCISPAVSKCCSRYGISTGENDRIKTLALTCSKRIFLPRCFERTSAISGGVSSVGPARGYDCPSWPAGFSSSVAVNSPMSSVETEANLPVGLKGTAKRSSSLTLCRHRQAIHGKSLVANA